MIPPWSHDSDVHFDVAGRDRFRKQHGLDGKFVIMYAGNHSPCHPLDTILEAANKLSGQSDIAFCFVGGGSEFVRVKSFAQKNQLTNVVCLPYQPIEQLAGSLSAADLHVVVMGNPFVGMIHPCKIYNILRIGTPLLYVGPKPRHISRILDEISDDSHFMAVSHGQSAEVIHHILRLKEMDSEKRRANSMTIVERFSIDQLLPGLVKVLEKSGVGK